MTLDPAVTCLIVACAELLFIVAAVHKLRDLRYFAEVFAAYQLVPFAVARRAAPIVALLELAVAAGLLAERLRPFAIGLGIVLLLAYAGAIGVNLLRGRRDIACGCGGPGDRRPIASWMIWRNLGIAIFMAGALLPWNDRPTELTDAVTVGFGTVGCALVYLCLDRLSVLYARFTPRTHR